MPHHNHRTALLLVSILCTIATAGDTIVDRHGSRTDAKVVRVLPGSVEYKKIANPGGPLYVVNRCDIAEIIYANGARDSFTDTCSTAPAPGTAIATVPAEYGRFAISLEIPYGAFGLFNVDTLDGNKFVKSKFTLGATPSFMVRIHPNISAGMECMLLWGQVDTTDPVRFIINPNLRSEIHFPLSSRLTLGLVAAGGLSIWPIVDTIGNLHPTFFNQRGGWNARASFGAEWKCTSALSLLCNVGYSASSSESDDIWITHDMMMVIAGARWTVGSVKFTKRN